MGSLMKVLQQSTRWLDTGDCTVGILPYEVRTEAEQRWDSGKDMQGGQ